MLFEEGNIVLSIDKMDSLLTVFVIHFMYISLTDGAALICTTDEDCKEARCVQVSESGCSCQPRLYSQLLCSNNSEEMSIKTKLEEDMPAVVLNAFRQMRRSREEDDDEIAVVRDKSEIPEGLIILGYITSCIAGVLYLIACFCGIGWVIWMLLRNR